LDPIVIVGSGLAGYTVAREFRKLEKEAPLILVTQDKGDFYSKPTLSNALAQNRTATELVTTAAAAMAAQLNIGIKVGATVSKIDCELRKLTLAGESIDYRALVLGCGADPVRLSIDGNAAQAILSVNDLSDYAIFREQLKDKHRIAILGGGLIGCEFANDLTIAGYAVTVIDPAPRPLASLLPEAAGQSMVAPLTCIGIQWRFGRAAKAVARDGSQIILTLDDGSKIEVDLVLSAVGLRPRTALAREAGIAVERGILVDNHARTSIADIFALGDCAQYRNGVMPYVMPIMHAARAIAQTLAGNATALQFPAMPISVKTPAWPVVIEPVAGGVEGQWVVESQSDTGLKMIFTETGGALRGFVLAGDLVKERMAMTKLVSVKTAVPA